MDQGRILATRRGRKPVLARGFKAGDRLLRFGDHGLYFQNNREISSFNIRSAHFNLWGCGWLRRAIRDT